MEHSTVGVILSVFTVAICFSFGLSYTDNDAPAAPFLDACTMCAEYSDSKACEDCVSEISPELEKRSAGFLRSQRGFCNCCFLSRFTNNICCSQCGGPTANGISKRSREPSFYHPLLRGGYYPKKNTMYNPLLRGMITKRSLRIYNPLLRGGSNGLYNYDPTSTGEYDKKSQDFYNPLLRGAFDKRLDGFSEQGYIFNPLLRGSFNKKSIMYHPFLRGGFRIGSGEGTDL